MAVSTPPGDNLYTGPESTNPVKIGLGPGFRTSVKTRLKSAPFPIPGCHVAKRMDRTAHFLREGSFRKLKKKFQQKKILLLISTF
jgi:hypothetical protein